MEITQNTNWSILQSLNTESSYYYDYWQPYFKEWYPTWYPVWNKKSNKIEQAFKITQKLVEKKMVKLDKVKDFTDLVKDISKII